MSNSQFHYGANRNAIYVVLPSVTGTNTRRSCKGCIYRRPLGSHPSFTLCHYLIDTGRVRGCPAENCSKKLAASKRGKRIRNKSGLEE